jgi:hypothetical protein
MSLHVLTSQSQYSDSLPGYNFYASDLHKISNCIIQKISCTRVDNVQPFRVLKSIDAYFHRYCFGSIEYFIIQGSLRVKKNNNTSPGLNLGHGYSEDIRDSSNEIETLCYISYLPQAIIETLAVTCEDIQEEFEISFEHVVDSTLISLSDIHSVKFVLAS